MENVKAGVAYEKLAYNKAYLNADQSNFLANKTVRFVLRLYG